MKERKKKSAVKEDGSGKEHKKPWQEVYATPEERRQRAVSLACDAMKNEQKTNTDSTDGTDVF